MKPHTLQVDNPHQIAYYVVNNIQHLPPIIRLFPVLKGIVITENKVIYDFINTKYQALRIPCYLTRNRKESQQLVVAQKVRTVIYPSYHVLYRAKAIQIFHGGLSDKNYVESLRILMYNLVLFPGEKTVDKVKKGGYLKYVPQWKVVGYPKFDPLANKSPERISIFNNGRKTILYAPTWVSQNVEFSLVKFSTHGESSLEVWSKEIIKALHKNYNIIIKYHSRIYRQPNDIYEQLDELIKSLNVQDTVVTRIDDNILPYMQEADLMISDVSSACYEWFHFNRPIVFANPSPENYKPSDNICSNTYAWQAGDVINRAEDIEPIIEKNLRSDSYQEIRNKIFNYAVYKPDGHATERQVKAILDYIGTYKNTPYSWLLLKTLIWKRIRKLTMRSLNKYYHRFKPEKIGK